MNLKKNNPMTCKQCAHYAWWDGDDCCLLRFVMIDNNEANVCEDYEAIKPLTTQFLDNNKTK